MDKRTAMEALVDMFKILKEPITTTNTDNNETRVVSVNGIDFVFDYNGDPIMIKRVVETSDELKEVMTQKLAKARETHKSLCNRFPEKGDMVDRASYIALGRIEVLEDLLKCLK